MSTITAILEADADGTLHLPLPTDLRQGKVRVVATLEPAPTEVGPTDEAQRTVPKPGSLTGFWMAPDFDDSLEDFHECQGD